MWDTPDITEKPVFKLDDLVKVGPVLGDPVIKKMTKALRDQGLFIEGLSEDDSTYKEPYEAQRRDCIIAIAIVIHEVRPDYDMDSFYEDCGYQGACPVHR